MTENLKEINYVYDTKGVISVLKHSSEYWKSFLHYENFEIGIFRLGPNEKDTQSPHKSDEVYYIIKGEGYIKINSVDYSISTGNTINIPKNTPHYFHGNKSQIIAFYVLN